MGSPVDQIVTGANPPRVTYDAEANAAYIYLADAIGRGEAVRQQVVDGDIILDFDASGRLLGIEVLDARRRLPDGILAMAPSQADERSELTKRSLGEIFSSPFNWCDRRCERCPLADACPVRRRERQRRWVHEGRGEDPDDPTTVVDDLADTMRSLMADLQRIANEEGIDLDAPLPSLAVSLDGRRLRDAGLALVTALKDLPNVDGGDELMNVATVVAMKCARVASYLELDRHTARNAWSADLVPNLLLLEHLRRHLRDAFSRLSTTDGAAPGRPWKKLDDMERVLMPLISEIGAEPRRVLAALVGQNAAPSPFCLVEEREENSTGPGLAQNLSPT
jgi:uncharacterized protein YuzE